MALWISKFSMPTLYKSDTCCLCEVIIGVVGFHSRINKFIVHAKNWTKAVFWFQFLGAPTHLYNWLCPLVCPSVGLLVDDAVFRRSIRRTLLAFFLSFQSLWQSTSSSIVDLKSVCIPAQPHPMFQYPTNPVINKTNTLLS